jgi:hypothetical protein
MRTRVRLATILLTTAGLVVTGSPVNRAMAEGHGSKPPAKGKKGPAVDTKDIQRCLKAKGQRRISCLGNLPKKHVKAIDVRDCLRSRARLQCLQRLLIPPPRLEPVDNTYPALPASLTQIQFPDFSSDGSRIIAAAQSSDFTGTQIVSFSKDGSDFRCLTCGAWNGAALLKPFPFEDGRRILVRIGQQSPIAPARHGVVECSPSVAECRQAVVIPINAPAATDPNVVQDQRELRIAPDGQHVALTQIRQAPSGHQTGIGIVGRLIRATNTYEVADPRVVAVGGELKTIAPDGQGIYFARFYGAFDANNPDDVYISLRDGSQRRATFAPDWDEDIGRSPAMHHHRGWIAVGSGRGTGELETLGRLRRPLAIEFGTTALNFASFGSPESAEPWLVDEYGARRSYIGQPLAPGAVAAGWDSRPNFNWSPQGNQVVYWQRKIGESATRVVVSHLRARKPTKPGPAKATPDPTWAPPLVGFVPPDIPLPQSRRGRISGRLRVSLGPSSDPAYSALLVVRYSHFSDTRRMVLNGSETSHFVTPGPLGGLYGSSGVYSADVTLSGRHHRYLRATNVVFATQKLNGVIESSYDGHNLTLGPIGG